MSRAPGLRRLGYERGEVVWLESDQEFVVIADGRDVLAIEEATGQVGWIPTAADIEERSAEMRAKWSDARRAAAGRLVRRAVGGAGLFGVRSHRVYQLSGGAGTGKGLTVTRTESVDLWLP